MSTDNAPQAGRHQPPPRRPIRSWQEAERNAAAWMRHWGYHDASARPGGADGGIDVRSSRALGQVKYQAHAVGRPELQRLFGARGRYLDRQLLFFTGSSYAATAVAYAAENDIALFVYALDGAMTPVNAPARKISFAPRKQKPAPASGATPKPQPAQTTRATPEQQPARPSRPTPTQQDAQPTRPTTPTQQAAQPTRPTPEQQPARPSRPTSKPQPAQPTRPTTPKPHSPQPTHPTPKSQRPQPTHPTPKPAPAAKAAKHSQAPRPTQAPRPKPTSKPAPPRPADPAAPTAPARKPAPAPAPPKEHRPGSARFALGFILAIVALALPSSDSFVARPNRTVATVAMLVVPVLLMVWGVVEKTRRRFGHTALGLFLLQLPVGWLCNARLWQGGIALTTTFTLASTAAGVLLLRHGARVRAAAAGAKTGADTEGPDGPGPSLRKPPPQLSQP